MGREKERMNIRRRGEKKTKTKHPFLTHSFTIPSELRFILLFFHYLMIKYKGNKRYKRIYYNFRSAMRKFIIIFFFFANYIIMTWNQNTFFYISEFVNFLSEGPVQKFCFPTNFLYLNLSSFVSTFFCNFFKIASKIFNNLLIEN